MAARGQTTNDLLTNLFIGYKAASDKKFFEYIEHKEEAYEDGEDMTPTALMRLARNKYKTRKDREIWKAPTEEDEKIIALEAELKRVKEASNKDRKGRANKGLKSPKKKGKGKNSKKPDWMLILQRRDSPHPKRSTTSCTIGAHATRHGHDTSRLIVEVVSSQQVKAIMQRPPTAIPIPK